MQSNSFLLMSAKTATLLVQIVVVKDLGLCVLVSHYFCEDGYVSLVPVTLMFR